MNRIILPVVDHLQPIAKKGIPVYWRLVFCAGLFLLGLLIQGVNYPCGF